MPLLSFFFAETVRAFIFSKIKSRWQCVSTYGSVTGGAAVATSAEEAETRLIFRTRWMPLASCPRAGPAADGEHAMRATPAWRCHALDAARRTNVPGRSASDI